MDRTRDLKLVSEETENELFALFCENKDIIKKWNFKFHNFILHSYVIYVQLCTAVRACV